MHRTGISAPLIVPNDPDVEVRWVALVEDVLHGEISRTPVDPDRVKLTASRRTITVSARVSDRRTGCRTWCDH